MTIEPYYMVTLPNGSLLETYEFGDGPIRIGFLHGLSGSPALIGHQLTQLASRHNATILAPRLPCHGHSVDVHRFDDFVETIGQWCRLVGLRQDCLIGYSLGAFTLPFVADRFPDVASKLLCLALVTRPVANRWDLRARVAEVFVDGLVSTVIGLADASAHWRAREFATAHLSVAREGFRLGLLLDIMQQVPSMEPVVARLTGVEIICLNADLDLVAGRRAPRRIGRTSRSHIPWGHGFPSMPWFWGAIDAALAELLSLGAVPVPDPKASPGWFEPLRRRLSHIAAALPAVPRLLHRPAA